MTRHAAAINVDAVLAGLKPFQRRSVDYVFDRLYGANATRRFLLADEVGLGKTHVARGVIARAIEHRRRQGAARIDIVYVCSNQDIARQNISRLNVTGRADFQLASRITLLPKAVHELEGNALNFVSFTPGTSFNLGYSPGKAEERVLLYRLLRRAWPKLTKGAAAINVLHAGMARENFRNWIRYDRAQGAIDRGLARRFREAIRRQDGEARAVGQPTYRRRFADLCGMFARSRENVPREQNALRNGLIGDLRGLLAATCIAALHPELVILDEFQRFRELLDPQDPAGSLARHLFAWGDARVLLLSATPYKMFTLADEAEADDHYKDFLATLAFLQDDAERTLSTKRALSAYGVACTRAGQDGYEALRVSKERLEADLRAVMCRTERLAVTEDRDGMLREVSREPLALDVEQVRDYVAVQRLARAMEQGNVIEYWKASPYLLNFMDAGHYGLKGAFVEHAENGTEEHVADALAKARESLLPRTAWRRYEEVGPRHALLARLSAETLGRGWWRLLWVPPSMPYHCLGGPFGEVPEGSVTKRLVFSAWHVVPRASSILLSYEAERRMRRAFDLGATNERDDVGPRQLLNLTRSDGRLTGMPVLALLHPSPMLAQLTDPLDLGATSREQGLASVLVSASERIGDALRPLLRDAPTGGPEDESWYWAAPILLERRARADATESWFEGDDGLVGTQREEGEGTAGWRRHVEHAAEVARSGLAPVGRPPADLPRVLALLGVAGPANCALRALRRSFAADDALWNVSLRRAASRVAWGMRSLFNSPDVIALLRALRPDEPYWLRVLEYAADGCLQAVLDEYVHMQAELMGPTERPAGEVALEIAEGIAAQAGLRVATPALDWVSVTRRGSARIESQRVRARFALRYGDERGDREELALRKDAVRAAFNSPFWPFVLVTTSIGQEGLDFHPYCHAVVHWNPPRNPVDLEQREGRVHRYKGHAVRKNVARHARGVGLRLDPESDPWAGAFHLAAGSVAGDGGIRPFWVFADPGGAAIERHAPALPLSREAALLPRLRASLAVYRMVFGQPRQDDLIDYLRRTTPESDLMRMAEELRIDLEPPVPAVVPATAR